MMRSPYKLPLIIVGSVLTVFLVLYVAWVSLVSISVAFTFNNNQFCREHLCLMDPGTLRNKDFLPKNAAWDIYSPTISYFCISLIELAYWALKDAELLVPDGFVFLTSLKNKLDNNKNIGYVFQQEDTLWVVFRGTLTKKDIQEDIILNQTPLGNGGARVHAGFDDLYRRIAPQLMDVVAAHPVSKLLLTGHSLGAGLCLLALHDLASRFGETLDLICYTYGCPRVGNTEFVAELRNLPNVCFRIANNADIFTQVPLPITFRPWQPRNPIYYDHYGKVFNFTDNRKNYTYNHSILTYLQNMRTASDILRLSGGNIGEVINKFDY